MGNGNLIQLKFLIFRIKIKNLVTVNKISGQKINKKMKPQFLILVLFYLSVNYLPILNRDRIRINKYNRVWALSKYQHNFKPNPNNYPSKILNLLNHLNLCRPLSPPVLCVKKWQKNSILALPKDNLPKNKIPLESTDSVADCNSTFGSIAKR